MRASIFAKLAAFAAALSLTGCATMFSGTTQSIHVQAVDSRTTQVIPGARCSISDDKGHTYNLDSNPDSVVVSKGKGALNVKCVKPGYYQKQIGVGQSFNAWTIVNVLFWPGIIVDALSGATQKYPSHITVMMEKSSK